MNLISRGLVWIAFNVNLGPLNPWIFGLAIWRWPHRSKK